MLTKLIAKYFQKKQSKECKDADILSSGEEYWSGKAVGGMWDKVGVLQFDFLMKQGLQSHYALLDVGCGSLRGGIHFIKYLVLTE